MPAADPAPPRDFTVLLPPGWVRIPLDGREKAAAAALATAKVADLAEPQRGQAREQVLQMLRLAIRHARDAGGIDIMMSLAERDGIPLAASCLVSYVAQDPPVSAGRLAAELGADGGEVSRKELAGCPAVRHRYLEGPVTRVDYHLHAPGTAGLLTMAFATPLEPLAGPLVLLFDAIAESLRWRS
jgi:hypothetical protein